MSTLSRRSKWHYPPPQTPRIIHLPRRSRRRATKIQAPKPTYGESGVGNKVKLEVLFDQERTFARPKLPIVLLECDENRRERVEEGGGGLVVEEEKWRFQAEMLRAECNLLRMEREIAVKKLERGKLHMERTLKSAVQTLITGRKRIHEGKNVGMELEEEIQAMVEKLEKLHRCCSSVRQNEVPNRSNFDERASVLQQRLERFRGVLSREMVDESLSINSSCRVDENLCLKNKSHVEILSRKMEGLSKGILLERMEEECGSMLSSVHISSRRISIPDSSSSSNRHPHQEPMLYGMDTCSGHCKAIVQRIVEQVRAETEQWSQMQEMLGQVREELEELQASRDFWEDRALNSDYQIQSLQSAAQEWRDKALICDSKTKELQAQIAILRKELRSSRKEQTEEMITTINLPQPLHRDAQTETEKRVLICRLKENRQSKINGNKQMEIMSDGRRKVDKCSSRVVGTKRLPFRDIGNSSSQLIRQNSRAIFPLHCPLPSTTD